MSKFFDQNSIIFKQQYIQFDTLDTLEDWTRQLDRGDRNHRESRMSIRRYFRLDLEGARGLPSVRGQHISFFCLKEFQS